MIKIKKFDEFINESFYDENDGFTSSVAVEPTQLPEVKELREKLNSISNCVTAIINKDEKKIEEIIGRKRGMMVCCKAGVGLTHSIEKGVLKANGTKEDLFTIHDGIEITPSILYNYLYKYNNKIIVIEDFERIFNNQHCLRMLKDAMEFDTNRRMLNRGTLKYPVDSSEKFTFNGYIILTSRMRSKELTKKYSEEIEPLVRRCEFFHIFPS